MQLTPNDRLNPRTNPSPLSHLVLMSSKSIRTLITVGASAIVILGAGLWMSNLAQPMHIVTPCNDYNMLQIVDPCPVYQKNIPRSSNSPQPKQRAEEDIVIPPPMSLVVTEGWATHEIDCDNTGSALYFPTKMPGYDIPVGSPVAYPCSETEILNSKGIYISGYPQAMIDKIIQENPRIIRVQERQQ